MLPEDRSYEDTLKRADNAMYEAKRRGKNRVVAADTNAADTKSHSRRLSEDSNKVQQWEPSQSRS